MYVLVSMGLTVKTDFNRITVILFGYDAKDSATLIVTYIKPDQCFL